jgi:hypothetical protein
VSVGRRRIRGWGLELLEEAAKHPNLNLKGDLR